MVSAERWLESSPSADVDEPEDEASEVAGMLGILSSDRINDLIETQLEGGFFIDPQRWIGTNVEHDYITGKAQWTGVYNIPGHIKPQWSPFVPVSETGWVSGFVTHTGFVAEESSPTARISEEPLLDAVARASDQQKEQIWRILGVTELHSTRRAVHPSRQPVSSDWLEEAVSAHARPTPISLEDWYQVDES